MFAAGIGNVSPDASNFRFVVTVIVAVCGLLCVCVCVLDDVCVDSLMCVVTVVASGSV